MYPERMNSLFCVMYFFSIFQKGGVRFYTTNDELRVWNHVLVFLASWEMHFKKCKNLPWIIAVRAGTPWLQGRIESLLLMIRNTSINWSITFIKCRIGLLNIKIEQKKK